MVSRKNAVTAGLLLGILATFATLAYANILTGAGASADCTGYSLTVNATDLTAGTSYTINYTFTLTCNGVTTTVPGSVGFVASNSTVTETVTGNWLSSGSLSATCTVTGAATLTSSGSTVNISVNGNGSSPATLFCGSTGTGKNFSIGPSSMEGDLHISPGDWISGGYNFKFVSSSHAATAYTVVATVTVPVVCPDNTVENVVIPLGAPGQLDGGGVTSFTYNIAAGDTSNHPTNNANSILSWEGAVQAPANLCGGQVGRNQTGAIFNANVTQNPHVGLVDWQFKYRDPNAKGKGNVNCTDASDPRRNDAATCGASWSQTVRDP